MSETKVKQEEKAVAAPRIVKVAIMTSYLTKNFGQDYDESYIEVQSRKFGYDPKNFAGLKALVAGRLRVALETSDSHSIACPHLADFAIAGSTTHKEEVVRNSMGSGLIVARYSTFYGGCSRYSGNSPEEGGYALDIPKAVPVVRAFLTNESVIDALLAREETKIRAAVDALNKTLPQPILVTPYLTEAVRLPAKCNASLECCARGG